MSEDKPTIVSSSALAQTEIAHTVVKSASDKNNGNTSININAGYLLNNRFLMEKKLGQGAMGAVFKAKDLRKEEAGDPNPYIAIKLIAGDFKQDPRAFVALQQETDKSQALSHENIISVYDFDRDGDIIYMTMQCLEGQSLNVYIANPNPALSAKDKLTQDINLIEQIAAGVAYAHKHGIVHSDLKPENIFITLKNEIKILDFGIARTLSELRNDGYVDSREGVAGLTPAYASAQMFRGEAPHPSDDVYGLGLIAYELITNVHPFSGKRAVDVLRDGNIAQPIKSLRQYQWKAIYKAMQQSRDIRWENSQQFMSAFVGKGRTTKLLIAGLVFAMLGLSTTSYLYTNVDQSGPEIPFTNLSASAQNNINQWLVEAKTALSFSDYNGAIFYFDKINILHPRNRRAAEGLDVLVQSIVVNKEALIKQGTYQAVINDLLTFPSLKLNEALLKEKKSF
jgi:serine/threonine protein kinase